MSANSTSLPDRKRSAPVSDTDSVTPPSAKKPCVTDMQQINATPEYSIESLSKLSTAGLEYMQKKIKAALHEQKKWAKVVECDRATAIQHKGGAFLGECGSHYFYFAPCNAEAFTAKQLECLDSSIACCFLCGQCCDEDDEDDEDVDPCECKMGYNNQSFSFMMNLDEETFDDECNAGLLPIKWEVQGECMNEKMYSIEHLRIEIGDLNKLSPKVLMNVATYLLNPVGLLQLPYSVIKSVETK
tara:strand:- start:1131 stop:1859 length:729 start_codon:yes stop_codon:yes gene_type:complete